MKLHARVLLFYYKISECTLVMFAAYAEEAERQFHEDTSGGEDEDGPSRAKRRRSVKTAALLAAEMAAVQGVQQPFDNVPPRATGGSGGGSGGSMSEMVTTSQRVVEGDNTDDGFK